MSTSIHVSAYPAIYSTTHSFPALFFLQQVVLECSLDFCFTYIFQYEPYMKDSVGFPKVTVSLMHTWVHLTCYFYALRCTIYCGTERMKIGRPVTISLRWKHDGLTDLVSCRCWCSSSMFCRSWRRVFMGFTLLDAHGCWTGLWSSQEL